MGLVCTVTMLFSEVALIYNAMVFGGVSSLDLTFFNNSGMDISLLIYNDLFS